METLAERLNFILKEQHVTQTMLAKKLKTKPQYIQAICSGRIKKPTNVIEMAQALGISPIWLHSGRGPKILPLDSGLQETTNKVPIVPWGMVGHIDISALSKDNNVRWFYAPIAMSTHSFALETQGYSMVGNEISFPPGYLITVDPEYPVKENMFVIAYLDGQPALRQYTVEGGKKYLRLLNQSYPNPIIAANNDLKLAGVVRGVYKNFA